LNLPHLLAALKAFIPHYPLLFQFLSVMKFIFDGENISSGVGSNVEIEEGRGLFGFGYNVSNAILFWFSDGIDVGTYSFIMI